MSVKKKALKKAAPKTAAKHKVKTQGKAKAKSHAAHANGSASELSVKPVPKSGPNLTLRARSQEQIDRIKRAAAKTKLSMNTWAIEVLEQAAAVA